MCEQLAQGRYLAVFRLGVEPATSGLQVRLVTITPPSHSVKVCYLFWCMVKLEQAELRLQTRTSSSGCGHAGSAECRKKMKSPNAELSAD